MERPYSEIAAFELDKLMGFRRAVPAAGRAVNLLKEIYPLIETEDLADRFFHSQSENFCLRANSLGSMYLPFCGHPEVIDGSLGAFLPVDDQVKLIVSRVMENVGKRMMNKFNADEQTSMATILQHNEKDEMGS